MVVCICLPPPLIHPYIHTPTHPHTHTPHATRHAPTMSRCNDCNAKYKSQSHADSTRHIQSKGHRRAIGLIGKKNPQGNRGNKCENIALCSMAPDSDGLLVNFHPNGRRSESPHLIRLRANGGREWSTNPAGPTRKADTCRPVTCTDGEFRGHTFSPSIKLCDGGSGKPTLLNHMPRCTLIDKYHFNDADLFPWDDVHREMATRPRWETSEIEVKMRDIDCASGADPSKFLPLLRWALTGRRKQCKGSCDDSCVSICNAVPADSLLVFSQGKWDLYDVSTNEKADALLSEMFLDMPLQFRDKNMSDPAICRAEKAEKAGKVSWLTRHSSTRKAGEIRTRGAIHIRLPKKW